MQMFFSTLKIKFTILGVTETWLTDINQGLYNIHNYYLVEKHRTNRPGGGVGIYVPENVQYQIRDDLVIFDDIVESIFIEINIDSKNIIVGNIYRPPGTDLNQFIESFNNTLSLIKSERKLCYLLGDWNFNLLNYESHVATAKAFDMFYSYSFMPLINRPTRISTNSATIIDNIFTNNHSDIANSWQGILITDISDHLPIFYINHSIQ